MGNNSIIQVSQVSKNYRDIPALINVSLQVERGEIFGLIGPDGAGKSTLTHIIAGILKPSQGQVSVIGKNVLRDPESIRSSIGFLPQGLGLALAQELSVEENLDYFAEINQVEKQKREEKKALLLKMTQLEEFRGRPAKNLSGGMQQKLALCCTLIHEPRLLLLDEPTTGVDPISRRDLWLLLNTMVAESGVSVLLTTAYMDEAARCHRVALMNGGAVIALGKPADLLVKLQAKVFSMEAAGREREVIKQLQALPDIEVAYPMGKKIHAIGRTGAKFEGLSPTTPTIEDLFLYQVANVKSAAVNEQAFQTFFQAIDKPPTQDQPPILVEAKLLEKKFNNFTAVKQISFGIRAGEIFGFLGPNGAGKTTTIKMLCGLLPPTSGTGTVAGFDLSKQAGAIKKNIGYMSQRFSLYGDLTVAENIELYGSIYGVGRREVLARRKLLLEITDLNGRENTITKELPLGIKQRLALSCAIIHKPSCVFLDEPTSGVDPVARRKFWDSIFLLSRQMGVTILVSTHHLDEAEYCDRLILIDQGSIRATGSADELRQKVQVEMGQLLEITAPDIFAACQALKDPFPGCSIYGAQIHLYTHDPAKDRQQIETILTAKGISLTGIKGQTMPFDNVFTYFCETGKEQTS